MKRALPFAALFAVFIASLVSAHETWLLPVAHQSARGDPLTLDLSSGMEFPTLDHPIKAERVAKAAYRLRGKVHTIADPTPADKSLRLKFTPADTGLACVWVQLKPNRIELTEKQVQEYFEEINASKAIRQAWAAQEGPKRWREVYTKTAKTFVRVSRDKEEDAWSAPVGASLEIVPEADPTALVAKDTLAVRVLKDGKPLAGLALGCLRAGTKRGTFQNTDNEGRVKLTFAESGRYLLFGTHLQRSEQKDTDWESEFTTLTLEVRER